jgi:hypothetical protein
MISRLVGTLLGSSVKSADVDTPGASCCTVPQMENKDRTFAIANATRLLWKMAGNCFIQSVPLMK